ncbi:Cytochrome P450 [Cordyceps fumosorosea ARSEF 2679]|uniref:Cytochrome P450 n=1 Tax=Cordyceps fumosorosea (strain ARSEF 2679) TaxID=1081104 RepID=A0A167NCL6_CORFA|nr:Cytochrome P450 [Cordyceps fumosorosea ARSEF 2679]OAA55399.1 Cytochrome P450 [Cordyceps fumosorosea ARSEF 2679]
MTVSTLRKTTSRIPGPWYTKWTSLVLKYYWIRGEKSIYVHSLHKKYGRIVRIGPDEVSVCDIDALKAIYSVKETFRKTPWYRDFVAGIENIFSTGDLDFHRKSRRLLAGPMADSAINELAPRVGGHVDLTIQQMKAESETRKAVDVWKWWLFMTTDIIVEFTFGESFHMLQHGKVRPFALHGILRVQLTALVLQENEYSYFLKNSGIFGIYRSVMPRITQLMSLLPLRSSKTAARAVATMAQAASDGLAIHQKLVEENGTDNVRRTFFTTLFAAEDGSTEVSQRRLVGDGQAFIIAGSDTTANTLTYAVWALARDTSLREALLAELRALPEGWADADLRRCGLLGRVIKETLRVHGVVPEGLPRVVPPGGAALCGFRLDGGTVVSAQSYSMHRDPAVFDRPDEFDPSRWVEPTKEMTDSFMAFGRGSRVCIGQHLAQTELRMGLARFFLTFPNARASTREGMSDEDMVESSYFIMSPKGHRCLIEVD